MPPEPNPAPAEDDVETEPTVLHPGPPPAAVLASPVVEAADALAASVEECMPHMRITDRRELTGRLMAYWKAKATL